MFTIAGLLNAPARGIQQHAYNQISQAFSYFCCHCFRLRFISNCILSNLTFHFKLFGNVSVNVSLHLHITLAVIRWQLVINYLLCSYSQASCRFVSNHFATVQD